MSATKKFDVCYPIATKNPDKPKWVQCGAIIETQKGFRLKMDVVPVVCDGWFALFEPKPKEAAAPAPPPRPAQTSDDDGFNDPIPF